MYRVVLHIWIILLLSAGIQPIYASQHIQPADTLVLQVTPLTVTIEQSAGQIDPASEAPINFTVTFSAPVTGFGDSDVDIVLGGNASGPLNAAISGGPSIYTVAVGGMTSNGVITAIIPAGVAQDAFATLNQDSSSTDNSVTFRQLNPVVTGIVRALPSPTNTLVVSYTITFSTPVVGVDVTDFEVVTKDLIGTQIADIAGTGTTYTLGINTGTGDGTLGLNLTDNDSITDLTSGIALGGGDIGNGNFSGQVYVIDRTVPVLPTITTPTNELITNNPQPAISGTAEALSTVTIYLDTTSLVTTTADIDGNWNVIPPVALADGAHVITAQATDAAGNTSGSSQGSAITVDTTVPVSPTITTPTNGLITNNPQPAINGIAEALSIVTIYLDDMFLVTTTADIDGNWNVALPAALADGTYIIAADATDTAGNTSGFSEDTTFRIDTTAPIVTVEQAAGQSDPATNAPLKFTVTFNEPVTGFNSPAGDIVLGGTVTGPLNAAINGGPSIYTITVSGMTSTGTVTVSVPAGAAQDIASNGSQASTSADNSITMIDRTAPATQMIAGPSNPSRFRTAYLSFTGSDNITSAPDLIYQCSLDAGAFTACTSPKSYTGLAQGNHRMRVRAIDAAGNIDPTPASFAWVVDLTPPNASLAVPPKISLASVPLIGAATDPITFTVTYTDNIAVQAATLLTTIRVDGPNGFSKQATLVAVDPSGDGPRLQATYQLDGPGGVWDSSAAGTYTLVVQAGQACDTAGNRIVGKTLGSFTVKARYYAFITFVR